MDFFKTIFLFLIIKNVSINILYKFFFLFIIHVLRFPLGIHLGVVFLGHMYVPTLLDNVKSFQNYLCQITFLQPMYESYGCSHFCKHLVLLVFSLLNIVHSVRCVLICHCGFNLYFPDY